MKRLFGLMILAPIFGLTLTSNAVADDTFCGAVPPALEILAPGTYDNVIVPAGLFCRIGGNSGGVTIVTGNVKVESGAGLQSFEFFGGAVTIGGSVQSDGAAFVAISTGTTVAGNVQIKGSTGSLPPFGPAASILSGASVVGNAQLEENSSFVFASFATIGGDLQLNKNTGGTSVSGNTVGGNLQCQDNVPAPLMGFPNMVTGDTDEQCAGF